MNNNVIPPAVPQVPSGAVGNVGAPQQALAPMQSMRGPMSGAPLPLVMGQVPAHASGPMGGLDAALHVPTAGQGVDARVRLFHALRQFRGN